MDNNTTALRELTLCDFDEPMLFSHGPAAPASVLAISCLWQEGGGAYLTLYREGEGSADFSIRRIFRSEDTNSYHLLLGLPPREAGSQVQRSSTMLPSASLTTLSHLMMQA